MKQPKRKSGNSFNHHDRNKKHKIQKTAYDRVCSPITIVSNFENLSNELIYEIFEFIDYSHVYQAFFHLNQRFQNLLTQPYLQIKTSFSAMSKSVFKRYNKDIIETNIDRINSLHFSDVFSYEFILTSICKLSKFTRLETLIFHNIEYKHLENILNQLPSLSLLSSLVITTVDIVTDRKNILCQILRLPSLKYCELSLQRYFPQEPLLFPTNEYSSIEHLIFTSYMYIDDLSKLLSYVPHLRHLSLGSLIAVGMTYTNVFPCLSNQLTHVSLSVKSVSFAQLEQLFKNAFHSVQVLRITSNYEQYTVPTYADANRWEQLIPYHLPNLRIFDIRLQIYAGSIDNQMAIKTELDHFTTPFWIERQWFFVYELCSLWYGKVFIFYSTNPYRRKDYVLSDQFDANTTLHHYASSVNSVPRVHIPNKHTLINCKNYFTNATELTFEKHFSTFRVCVITMLNRIISLKQLTKLVISCDRFPFQTVIKILYYSPNIHTLKLKSMPCNQKRNVYTSISNSEDFQLVCNTNVIRHVTCDTTCTLDKIKLLVALCPRMQHLSIDTLARDVESVTRLLLDKTKQSTSQLYLLCFSKPSNNWITKLETLIQSETLVDDYTLNMIRSKLYLWW